MLTKLGAGAILSHVVGAQFLLSELIGHLGIGETTSVERSRVGGAQRQGREPARARGASGAWFKVVKSG